MAIRQWNYNFNLGGPGCTIKTLEGLTGIFVDHYVVIDFPGFQQMVDALGGVPVCTTSRHRRQGRSVHARCRPPHP